MLHQIASLNATLEERQGHMAELETRASGGDDILAENVDHSRSSASGDSFYALVNGLRQIAVLLEDISVFTWDCVAAQLWMWPADTATAIVAPENVSPHARVPQFEAYAWEIVASVESSFFPVFCQRFQQTREMLYDGFEQASGRVMALLPIEMRIHLSYAGEALLNTTDAVFVEVANAVSSARTNATEIVETFLTKHPEHKASFSDRDPLVFVAIILGVGYLTVQQFLVALIFVCKCPIFIAQYSLFAMRWLMRVPLVACGSCCRHVRHEELHEEVSAAEPDPDEDVFIVNNSPQKAGHSEVEREPIAASHGGA